jgi:BirA family transcriptional regulator, biotin operon repressor / biotin---[acetyl-CoA-carboxylase] ligase
VNIPLLLQLRRADGAFVSFADLGATAMRDLDELEAFGFALERHPYQGVAYRGPADRLCPDQIEFELATTRIGRRIAVWNRVASTNDLAARAAVSRANEGLVVLAESQTAGRGRRGRHWSAPAGSSVLMSVLLFPPEPLADSAWLTALGAVAVAEVVAEWTGAIAAIKWPNDVRVDKKKIAGILVERSTGAVLGIGLNANLRADDLPTEIRDGATSLRDLTGAAVDRSNLVRDLIRRLDTLYERSLTDGPAILSAPWRARSEHLGAPVVVATATGPVSGRLDDLDLWDGLTLTDDHGDKIRVAARHVLAIEPTGVRERGS